jgi:squalene cyclase
MTTANEVDDKNPTPYVFVSGDAEQEHQDEINRFASKGYRVIGMSQNSASVSDGIWQLRAALDSGLTDFVERR